MRLFVVALVAVALAGCFVDPETVSGTLVALKWSGSTSSTWRCRAEIEPVNGNEQSGWSYDGYNASVCQEAEALLGRCVLMYHADVGKVTRRDGSVQAGPNDGIVWTREEPRGCAS